uniref:Palmitoyltransferase n=1 Tax=Chromera velia CCMP2878 TaxID=1169474 RepID=A0A0G4F0H7_9ALVE|eukprot:Cvel_14565.t1-p1 / transcript=Cvel_14565.t1 / gene=Cvel_14565 / organism=Chromera_velia_CCMP2878 / gene_product=Probable S-acyltransferase At5g41060, putative / transcript_product=Probable S-acyltransferase At5g41060, putative / location=Cvel_scaffold1041:8020-12962(-) / protein_length=428 / sequence_SO=supercontig / SO=protein_coding / is_pseudo=false
MRDIEGGPDVEVIGKNRVICGICLTGPELWNPLLSIGLLTLPCVVFHAFVSPWYIEKYGAVGSLVVIFGALLMLTAYVSFASTALSDPGIMKRQKDPKNSYDAITQQWRDRSPPRWQDAQINGRVVRLKFCSTCNIYRPPRCVHCAVCDNCVERFDHHCPWVGNCVGRRNYRSFYMFIFSTSVLCLYVLGISCHKMAVVVQQANDEGENAALKLFGSNADAPLLAAYVFLAIWFVGGLCAYHTFLVGTEQTTYEALKGLYADGNPFHRGLIRNFASVLCRFPRQMYFDPRHPELDEFDEPRSPTEIVPALQAAYPPVEVFAAQPPLRNRGYERSLSQPSGVFAEQNWAPQPGSPVNGAGIGWEEGEGGGGGGGGRRDHRVPGRCAGLFNQLALPLVSPSQALQQRVSLRLCPLLQGRMRHQADLPRLK